MNESAGNNTFRKEVTVDVPKKIQVEIINQGASGTFTTADTPAKTVTVVNGVITSIA